ncbi:MAG TPA: response regulator [Cyclobacteriaceae bacterium]|nr:response regulator [Cyclobacteriaceae bacterium]HMV08483.1 response regulator [Cyclobacteriaceae bacterium]HMV89194.1 response regulator [Cyclobacteriaceae bacterium]HMX01256.1 response regulator [Cyclobacteriaceae bacterium]HMX51330.1 response regulator [Cyclobacteriaceae bacterium]
MKTMNDTKKIMLVDDDCMFILIHRRMLELSGITAEIQTASSGKEALELLLESEKAKDALPDVILLDLTMPGMDGFEFLANLEKLRIPEADKMKIIIVTSSADPRDKARLTRFKIENYLQKPVQREVLLDSIGLRAA